MMIPTNYLRYVKFWATNNQGQDNQYTVQLTKLQQWWSRNGEGPNGEIGRTIGTAKPEGEWRDVETVEEA